MVVDANGDSLADFIAGKVVPAHPSGWICRCSHLAARLAFVTTGFTAPVVIGAGNAKIASSANFGQILNAHNLAG